MAKALNRFEVSSRLNQSVDQVLVILVLAFRCMNGSICVGLIPDRPMIDKCFTSTLTDNS